MTDIKRITLFVGHYGSGKTNIAVNFAEMLAREGKRTAIADLDIVNPYFRTKDSAAELDKQGIRLISPMYANTNVDLPALPSEIYGIMEDRQTYAVLDVGGDDRGALALGRFAPYIKEENDFDMLFVANMYRPLTRTAADAMEVLKEIEAACGLKVTGIVNNSNLGADTTPDTVRDSEGFIKELCDMSGLPLRFTAAEKGVYNGLKGSIANLFPIVLQKKIF